MMNRRQINLRTFALSLAVCIFPLVAVGAETLTVQDPRPVAQAIEELERIYGEPITYEDPFYLAASELREVAPVGMDGDYDERAKRVLIPRAQTLSFSYELPALDSKMEASSNSAVTSALSNYNAMRGSEMFEFYKVGRATHVIPTSIIDKSGRVQPFLPPLSYSISITPKTRNLNEFLEAFSEALSEAAHIHVVLGSAPDDLLKGHLLAMGADKQIARAVLDDVLQNSSVFVSWQAFYDPKLQWYVLNFHVVTKQ